METITILNSPILTTPGTYRLTEISLSTARELLRNKITISAIGHASTAEFLTELLGAYIPRNRIRWIQPTQRAAIVFKLISRLSESEILSLEELRKSRYTFYLLERID